MTRVIQRLKGNAHGIHPMIYQLLITSKILPALVYVSPVFWTGKEDTIEALQLPYHRAI